MPVEPEAAAAAATGVAGGGGGMDGDGNKEEGYLENERLYPIPTSPEPVVGQQQGLDWHEPVEPHHYQPDYSQQPFEPPPVVATGVIVSHYPPLTVHSFATRDIKRSKRLFFIGLITLIASFLLFWTLLLGTLLWFTAVIVSIINFFSYRSHADPAVRVWANRSGFLLFAMFLILLVEIGIAITMTILASTS